jgi:SAM-dependent methyltransferase
MATQLLAPRLAWAVDTLGVEPDDHVLEIGCGHGLAAAVVCERLVDGHLIAIDRSLAMIRAANRRNRTHVANGLARFEAVPLARADFGDERFDKIFAVNVSLFAGDSTKELGVIRRHLAPGGTLQLSFQAPVARQTREMQTAVVENLCGYGFRIVESLYEELDPLPAACIVAEPRSNAALS